MLQFNSPENIEIFNIDIKQENKYGKEGNYVIKII